MYNTFYRNYLVFNLGSFGVLQAHDNNLSNNALKKFLNAAYGLNTEKLDLYNVQRIYGLQSGCRSAVIIFDYKGCGSKYYECKIVTKNNNFVFPVSSLPRYIYSFNLINYLWYSKNFTGKDTVFHKYIVENREDFITNVNKIIQDEISAEEFLMRFYV